MVKKAYILDGKRMTKDEYNKAKFDRFLVTVQKGHKAEIQAHAEARGESVNGFINRAISEAMERDNAAPWASEGRTEAKENAGE